MPVSSNSSVVLLACVNSYADGKKLRHLVNERKLITRILNSYQKPSLFQPVQKEGLSNACFFDHLDENQYQENVSFIHLVGHVDNDHLRIESENVEVPIHVEELSNTLAMMPNLQAVFLSGCATPKILESLLKKDIPAIFVTETKEKNIRATGIARSFYQAISKGSTVKQAFEAVKRKYPEMKANRVEYNIETDSFLWKGKKTASLREEMSWGMYYLAENEGLIGRNFHSHTISPINQGIGSHKYRSLKRKMEYLTYVAAATALTLLMVGLNKYIQTIEAVDPFFLSLTN